MPASLLETVLAHGDLQFLTLFFRCWEPSTIFLLGRLSYRLRSITHFYSQSTWSVSNFLSRWFPDSKAVLQMLDSAPAIICGASVLQFFDRTRLTETRLDICVDFGGLGEVGKFLASQGYIFRPVHASGIKDFDLAILVEASQSSKTKLNVQGDQSSCQEHHGSRSFKFVKTSRGPPSSSRVRVVIVQLVRCELHRFVFGMHSTAFMNYIDSRHAISVFPRSAFIHRLSFIACQEKVPGVDETMTELGTWLDIYSARCASMKIVGTSNVQYRVAEVGPRWVGDERCWIVPCVGSATPLPGPRPVEGPAFDVLDWRLGATRHGSYLRVGEPWVWRYVLFFLCVQ
ncbi:hypothetical protein DFH09DRAFT_1030426 [Mycena vulgaris]|nr:hypothetical protein DFH09DRAFT_1030426 [Mycena vulgaris]